MKRSAHLAAAGALLLAVLFTWAGAAQAFVLGNPSPDFKKGNAGVGLSLSDFRETLFFDYGISDAGTLQVLAGNLTPVKGGPSGTELGVGYRHKIPSSIKVGNFPLNLGVMGAYRTASINTGIGSLKYNLVDIGVGGAITPTQNLNTYAAAVYERYSADVVLPFVGKVSDTKSNLGFLAGVEYWLAPSFVAGLELHPSLQDDGVAIFGEFKF